LTEQNPSKPEIRSRLWPACKSERLWIATTARRRATFFPSAGNRPINDKLSSDRQPRSNYFPGLGVLTHKAVLSTAVHSHNPKKQTGLARGTFWKPRCTIFLRKKIAVRAVSCSREARGRQSRGEEQMRYVSVRAQAYSIRLGHDCLFNLIYEVTHWREGSERWFLVRAQEAEDLA
jgi:hypothetical protein